MGRRKPCPYPRVVYGPYGASMTIRSPSEWPDGWSATPETMVVLAEPVAPEKIPFTRSELKRKLREAGIPFVESSADAELFKRLLNG